MWERKGKKEEHTITTKHKVKSQYITNSNKQWLPLSTLGTGSGSGEGSEESSPTDYFNPTIANLTDGDILVYDQDTGNWINRAEDDAKAAYVPMDIGDFEPGGINSQGGKINSETQLTYSRRSINFIPITHDVIRISTQKGVLVYVRFFDANGNILKNEEDKAYLTAGRSVLAFIDKKFSKIINLRNFHPDATQYKLIYVIEANEDNLANLSRDNFTVEAQYIFDSIAATVQNILDQMKKEKGFTQNAASLLINILRNGTYSTDQTANIDALAAAITPINS